ncbi:MAG: hypothetical protein L6Q37_15060, partial [Bdellovibrionaceae bacterium]|nr:hypothetical protein [Pseudobdellovibrionaceae bacterium]
MLKVFANLFWVKLSAELQKRISSVFAFMWTTKFSRFVILPYCWLFSLDSDYLEQFESEAQKNRYSSYSDFFERRYKKFPQIKSSQVWPCEGYVCDWGIFNEKTDSLVKGQRLDLNSIFQSDPKDT